MKIRRVIVLGGGSAGFMAALALKTKLPKLDVQVIRSKEIGIIGVGEGSTIGLTNFLHDYLKVGMKRFHETAQPTWKMGLKFLWGPRESFYYTFGAGVDGMFPDLSKSVGFYLEPNEPFWDLYSALMARDKAFERNGAAPKFHPAVSYHFENEKFVTFLEEYALSLGVRIVDDTVEGIEQDENGIAGLVLRTGATAKGDLYVDCSGFASMLLHKTFGEPFVDFKTSLFCDRAVVGGWERGEEAIKPYTTCETMSSGWCWQIEHMKRINRGYVYSSNFISDEDAEREFRSKNPKVGPTRIVRFVSGCYARCWVKNVVAIGNAAGFVEPLEATALGVAALQSQLLADTLVDSEGEPSATQKALYNDYHRRNWNSIRGFIAMHYKFNERIDTPFWRACLNDTELGVAEPIVAYYRENGPTPLWSQSLMDPIDQFKYTGYSTMLVGMNVPYARKFQPSEGEARLWQAKRRKLDELARNAMGVREALDVIHSPRWRWC